jgi:hypothetical protein
MIEMFKLKKKYMKGIISIFTLPQEIDDLGYILEKLKRNSVYIDASIEYVIDITVCLADELTNWANSKLPKEYFEYKSKELVEKYCDWCMNTNLYIETSNNILGCVSQRRESLGKHFDADFFIWLDTDMVFNDTVLYYMESAFKSIKQSGINDFILTPQFVKQWDNTWDTIVNKAYLDYPINFNYNCNIYKEVISNSNEINIRKINQFKFAGGWFTLITKSLLDKIGIPESFGHYGLEDTYIMACSSILSKNGEFVNQYVLDGLIVGENYKNRPNQFIKSFLSVVDRKNEFKNIANSNWNTEINNFISRISK